MLEGPDVLDEFRLVITSSISVVENGVAQSYSPVKAQEKLVDQYHSEGFH